jgi:hypothetical protein
VKEAIIEIIKWIRESLRPLIVLFILSGLVLFCPRAWVAAIGVEDAVQKYRFATLLVFGGSFIWLASFPIEAEVARRKGMRYLKNLTEDEKNTLKPFIANSKRTQSFAMGAPVARHLTQRQILKETKALDLRGHAVFAIEDWAFARLRANPELIGLEKKAN